MSSFFLQNIHHYLGQTVGVDGILEGGPWCVMLILLSAKNKSPILAKIPNLHTWRTVGIHTYCRHTSRN